MWDDLWAALALMLVIEGIMPFLSPDGMRRVLVAMLQMDNRSIRIAGLISMLVGVALLYWVRRGSVG
ncbi:MAG: DUF2065 domain-containing protein [Gammaproteobacteria bacterium]|jgi:uncharacterized protein YjeT (DUF2065 family)